MKKLRELDVVIIAITIGKMNIRMYKKIISSVLLNTYKRNVLIKIKNVTVFLNFYLTIEIKMNQYKYFIHTSFVVIYLDFESFIGFLYSFFIIANSCYDVVFGTFRNWFFVFLFRQNIIWQMFYQTCLQSSWFDKWNEIV